MTLLEKYFPKKCNKPRIVRHQVVGCKTLLRQLTGLLQTLHFQHQWPATDHNVTHNTFLKHILHGSHSLSLTFHQIWRDPLQHATASRWIIGCSSLIRQMKSCSLSFRLPYQQTFQDVFSGSAVTCYTLVRIRLFFKMGHAKFKLRQRIFSAQVVGSRCLIRQMKGLGQSFHLQYQTPAVDHLDRKYFYLLESCQNPQTHWYQFGLAGLCADRVNPSRYLHR